MINIAIDEQGYLIACNFVQGGATFDNNIEYDETFIEDFEHFKLHNDCYKLVNNELIFDEEKQTEKDNLYLNLQLRQQREEECFKIINQNFVKNGISQTWFDTLTEEQKAEANAWVQAWRDVTDCHVVPQKPNFI